MRYLLVAVMLGFVVLLGSSVQAEMYKYRDARGNVCYTDNLAQIPENQRPTAHTMQAINTDGAAAQKKESAEELNAGHQDESDDPEDLIIDAETIAALNDRKKELDSEFSGLMSEKYTLLKEKERLSGLAGRDVKAREAYEGKVADLNNRIADYKVRRDAFQQECKQVKQTLEPSSPEEKAETSIE